MGERSSTLLFALLVGALILGCGTGEQTDARIESRFRNPPNESRMADYWWIFGPAWTDDEINRELQVLSDAGRSYGGFTIPQELSPRRIDAKTVRFTGAASGAATVRLPEACLNNGPRLVLGPGDTRTVAEVWANGDHAGMTTSNGSSSRYPPACPDRWA